MAMRGIMLAGIVSLAGMGAASAQPTAGAKDDTTGIFCVYNALAGSEDAAMVAQVFLSDAVPEENIGRAALVVGDATTDCAQTHGLSDSQAAAMSDMGIYGTVIDYLSGQLKADGVQPRGLKQLFDVYDGLSEDEVAQFLDLEWRSNIAFSGKLKQQLKAGGIPDKDSAIDASFDIFEVSAMADQAIFLFLVDDL